MPASRQLLADQFARLAELPVRVVEPTGTPNAIYRLGDDLYARLPRVRSWASALHQAALIIPYYRQTNPEFAALAVRTVAEGLSDFTA